MKKIFFSLALRLATRTIYTRKKTEKKWGEKKGRALTLIIVKKNKDIN